jgi:hypothetical protein
MKRNQTANEQVPDDNHKIYWYTNEHNGRQGMDPIATAREQNGPGIFMTLRIE